MTNYPMMTRLVNDLIERGPLDKPVTISAVERQMICHNLTEYAALIEALQKAILH